MAEHEPFASPYHQVLLPGQRQERPPGRVSPVVTPPVFPPASNDRVRGSRR